jgi:hypothetical protein
MSPLQGAAENVEAIFWPPIDNVVQRGHDILSSQLNIPEFWWHKTP